MAVFDHQHTGTYPRRPWVATPPSEQTSNTGLPNRCACPRFGRHEALALLTGLMRAAAVLDMASYVMAKDALTLHRTLLEQAQFSRLPDSNARGGSDGCQELRSDIGLVSAVRNSKTLADGQLTRVVRTGAHPAHRRGRGTLDRAGMLDPPTGHARWSLRLLERQITLVEYLPDMDHSTIGPYFRQTALRPHLKAC